VSLKQEIDIQSQIEEKKKELDYQLGFVASVQKKLENERFVSGAPKDVVDKERAKLKDGQERVKILEEEIQRLKDCKPGESNSISIVQICFIAQG
jgi:valyl-tRNA synthetase